MQKVPEHKNIDFILGLSGDTVESRVYRAIFKYIERYTSPEKLPCIFTRASEMRALEIIVSKKRLNQSNSK